MEGHFFQQSGKCAEETDSPPSHTIPGPSIDREYASNAKHPIALSVHRVRRCTLHMGGIARCLIHGYTLSVAHQFGWMNGLEWSSRTQLRSVAGTFSTQNNEPNRREQADTKIVNIILETIFYYETAPQLVVCTCTTYRIRAIHNFASPLCPCSGRVFEQRFLHTLAGRPRSGGPWRRHGREKQKQETCLRCVCLCTCTEPTLIRVCMCVCLLRISMLLVDIPKTT